MSQLIIDDLMFFETSIAEKSNVKGGLLDLLGSLEAQAIELGYVYQRSNTENTDTIAIANVETLPGGGMVSQSASAAISVI